MRERKNKNENQLALEKKRQLRDCRNKRGDKRVLREDVSKSIKFTERRNRIQIVIYNAGDNV